MSDSHVVTGLPPMRRAWDRLRSSGGVPLLLVGSAAALLFAYRYAIDPSRPGLFTPEGWFGFSDQSSYLRMARSIADGHLHEPEFFYGPGYPAVAVPFLWIGMNYDPWAIPNGLAFVFVVCATFVAARRLFSATTALIASAALLFASPLVDYVVTPWSSTASLVAAAAILLVGTGSSLRAWHYGLIGAMVALGFAARYVDVIWLAILAIGVILVQPPAARIRGFVVASAAAAALIVPVLGAQAVILGSPFKTPYEAHVRTDDPGSDQDATSYRITNIPRAAFGMFVSPFLRGARFGGEPLLQSMFWVLLAVPGAVLAIRRKDRWRPLMIATVASAVLGTLFYLSFRTSGPGAVQFGGLHYFKMFWPLLAILSAEAAVAILRRVTGARPSANAAAQEMRRDDLV